MNIRKRTIFYHEWKNRILPILCHNVMRVVLPNTDVQVSLFIKKARHRSVFSSASFLQIRYIVWSGAACPFPPDKVACCPFQYFPPVRILNIIHIFPPSLSEHVEGFLSITMSRTFKVRDMRK